ncbi:unnamed protein product [Miscanthus lutarioriparius]|uniref:Uncharacterized protein n=1 Tax=Miscanthus lutarioriparius TaxID=422564 RepID=A0A811RZD3_9POAL|nr:unnamed protein product [Miscanthus lutarioriparius]
MGNGGDDRDTGRAVREGNTPTQQLRPNSAEGSEREEGSRAGVERKPRRMGVGAPPGVEEAAPPWMLEGTPPGVVKRVVRDGSGEGGARRRRGAGLAHLALTRSLMAGVAAVVACWACSSVPAMATRWACSSAPTAVRGGYESAFLVGLTAPTQSLMVAMPIASNYPC